MRKRKKPAGNLAALTVTSLVVAGLLTSCEKPATQSSPDVTASISAGNSPANTSQPIAVTTSSGVEKVYLPGGEFMMGSDKGNPDEAPVHKVQISPFLMDKFEVTYEMFAKAQVPN